MFQLEILDLYISGKDRDPKDRAVYVVCRAVVGDFPREFLLPVWVYGAGKPTVKATMSYVWVHSHALEGLKDALNSIYGRRVREAYVLYGSTGEEIAVGMMISDVPPDALQDHAEE